MSKDRSDDETTASGSADPGASLAPIADAVGDILSGASIPAPLKRNALKAFNQLCTALIDIPVAYLEGVAAERRAETQARVKIISTGADQIAEQMDVSPEFARAAVRKFGQRIVREQVNLDQISRAAAQQLNATPPTTGPGNEPEPPAINDDWLNTFEKEASQKSTGEMQAMFAKILSGEIRKPSTFSIRTVKLLGQLDTPAAALFRKLCSLSISLRIPGMTIDARVPALDGNASSNSLQAYGLSFGNLNTLHEYGLIIPDYNSWMDYRPSVAFNNAVALPLTYQGQHWALVPSQERKPEQDLRVSGVALSHSGAELLNVVDLEKDDRYTQALQAYFARLNLVMAPVGIPRPGA
jgi:hypothetical protein